MKEIVEQLAVTPSFVPQNATCKIWFTQPLTMILSIVKLHIHNKYEFWQRYRNKTTTMHMYILNFEGPDHLLTLSIYNQNYQNI